MNIPFIPLKKLIFLDFKNNYKLKLKYHDNNLLI